MARKTTKRQQPDVPLQPPKPLRGRPPNEPRTTLARWIRDGHMTVADFADRLPAVAGKLGIPPGAAPRAKTLLDSVNGRHWPHPMTILLVRNATNGDVDLEHWARDLRHLWPPAWDDKAEVARARPQKS